MSFDLSSYFCGARPADLAGHYDFLLVGLSVAIAVIGSYTALDLAERARAARANQRRLWLALSSVAMGGGIWAMHFIAMLAFSLDMPITYDVPLTVLSLAAAILVCAAGLYLMARRPAHGLNLVAAGTFMGLGVASMHYIGMQAMTMGAGLSFKPMLYTASVAIAIAAATVALWLAFNLGHGWQKIAASIAMGVAIAGMHYTGMAAANFTPMPDTFAGGTGHSVSLLATVVTVTTLGLLLIGLVTSIADRRLAIQMNREAQAVRQNERLLRTVLDTAHDAFVSVDSEGRITGWNTQAESMFGWRKDEVIGRLAVELIIPEHRRKDHQELLLRRLAARGSQGLGERIETTSLRRDGSQIPVELSISQMWVDGKLTVSAFIRDVSRRRAVEQELIAAKEAAESASEAKSSFLANMSHELRTPLNAVIGFAEIIEKDAFGPTGAARYREYARDIKESGRHLLDVINDILDVSKADADRMDLREEPCDLGDIVTLSVRMVREAAQGGQVELAVAPADGLPLLYADAQRVRQILINLLSNAVKFTPPHGKVTVRVAVEKDGNLAMTVADTGIGMTPSEIEIALSPFGQVDSQLNRKFQGTGLGLPLTKRLLQLHRGGLTISSVPGEGTTVTARFPAERLRLPGEVWPLPESAASPDRKKAEGANRFRPEIVSDHRINLNFH